MEKSAKLDSALLKNFDPYASLDQQFRKTAKSEKPSVPSPLEVQEDDS
jgi:hypothetical protein